MHAPNDSVSTLNPNSKHLIRAASISFRAFGLVFVDAFPEDGAVSLTWDLDVVADAGS